MLEYRVNTVECALMALRRCLDCPRLTPDSRCPEHKRTKQQAKDAKRPERRTYAEQERRRQQVSDQPWCSVCGATEDLTADHVVPIPIAVAAGLTVAEAEAGPLVTKCRSHNSAKAARRSG